MRPMREPRRNQRIIPTISAKKGKSIDDKIPVSKNVPTIKNGLR